MGLTSTADDDDSWCHGVRYESSCRRRESGLNSNQDEDLRKKRTEDGFVLSGHDAGGSRNNAEVLGSDESARSFESCHF